MSETLPPGIERRANGWLRVVYKDDNGKRKTLSVNKFLGEKTRDIEKAKAVKAFLDKKSPIPPFSNTVSSTWSPSRDWARHTLNAVRKRKSGCTLDIIDVLDMGERSRGYCEVTGLAFIDNKLAGEPHPLQPSLDRINSAEGYHVDNCRLVCLAVNIALNRWGENVFETIAKAYVQRKISDELVDLMAGGFVK